MLTRMKKVIIAVWGRTLTAETSNYHLLSRSSISKQGNTNRKIYSQLKKVINRKLFCSSSFCLAMIDNSCYYDQMSLRICFYVVHREAKPSTGRSQGKLLRMIQVLLGQQALQVSLCRSISWYPANKVICIIVAWFKSDAFDANVPLSEGKSICRLCWKFWWG